jgi:hypothetical protein
MTNFSIFAQILVAVSIFYVWIFRFDTIVKDFDLFGLTTFLRSLVGASKIALSTLLFAGIWYPSLILMPSLSLAFFMIAAQYFHFKIGNPWKKHLPSLILLILCLFIATVSLKLL